jgi:hypothetical protein
MSLLTKLEIEKIENHLVPGLHSLDLEGKKLEDPTDLQLFRYVSEQVARIRELSRRYYNVPIMDVLNAAVKRVSEARIVENMAKTGKDINIRSRHRSQRDAHFQGGESLVPTQKPLPGGKK